MSTPVRRWLEIRARGPEGDDRSAMLAEGLLALGGRAVEEREGWFLTHVSAPDDTGSYATGARELLMQASGLAEVELGVREISQKDWAESWKWGLAPRRITSRLVVTPTWEPVDAAPGELVVMLDPGMAFGTAEHGTTRGCLRLLDRAVTPGARILDVGAGSGILSIAAAIMGAGEVLALEADEIALDVLAENVRRNGVEDLVTSVPGSATSESLAALGPRDGVVSNIESRTLLSLLPGFRAALGKGGWMILSGIRDVEWAEVHEAAEAEGLSLESVDADGEWRAGWFVLGS